MLVLDGKQHFFFCAFIPLCCELTAGLLEAQLLEQQVGYLYRAINVDTVAREGVDALGDFLHPLLEGDRHASEVGQVHF